MTALLYPVVMKCIKHTFFIYIIKIQGTTFKIQIRLKITWLTTNRIMTSPPRLLNYRWNNNQSDQSIANSFLSRLANSKCRIKVISFFHFCQVLHLSPSLTKENKDFKMFTNWGPGAAQRGPKSEIFWA